MNPIPSQSSDKYLKLDGVIESTWRVLVGEGKALEVVVGYTLPEAYLLVRK